MAFSIHKPENAIGKKFGRLMIEDIRRGENNRAIAITRCECGTEKEIRFDVIKKGDAVSCGCYRLAFFTKHGHDRGGKRTKEYQAWLAIKSRTTNKNFIEYHRYMGRGITMCSRWNDSFEAFLEDVGRAPSPKHSIERMNNDGNYEPGNVRWATRPEQARNTCRTVLNQLMVDTIRQLKDAGLFSAAISRILGVKIGTVENVFYGHNWKVRI